MVMAVIIAAAEQQKQVDAQISEDRAVRKAVEDSEYRLHPDDARKEVREKKATRG